MAMSCNSKVRVDVEDPLVQRRSVKPEWHKEQARFIINLCMEKERAANGNNIVSSFSSSYASLGARRSEPELENGYRSWVTGSTNNTSSPDAYVWRQRYLRSYTFTRKEESSNEGRKKGLHAVVSKKTIKRLMNQVSRGSGTTKEGKKMKISCMADSCLKFLLFFVTKLDVRVG